MTGEHVELYSEEESSTGEEEEEEDDDEEEEEEVVEHVDHDTVQQADSLDNRPPIAGMHIIITSLPDLKPMGTRYESANYGISNY